jgi:hypothetical protein
MPRLHRVEKLLCALAAGAFVVNLAWVRACQEAGRAVAMVDFELDTTSENGDLLEQGEVSKSRSLQPERGTILALTLHCVFILTSVIATSPAGLRAASVCRSSMTTGCQRRSILRALVVQWQRCIESHPISVHGAGVAAFWRAHATKHGVAFSGWHIHVATNTRDHAGWQTSQLATMQRIAVAGGAEVSVLRAGEVARVAQQASLQRKQGQISAAKHVVVMDTCEAHHGCAAQLAIAE